MDRFVTRAPTWKTLNYGSLVAAQSMNNNRPANPKNTLQAKQLDGFMRSHQDIGSRISGIFRTNSAELPVTDNMNCNGNSNDSGLSSASSISPPQQDENMRTPTKKNFVGKLGDYVDCPEEKENDTCMTITRTPKSSKKATESKVKTVGLKENTPSKQILPQTPKVNKLITTVPNAAKTAEPLTPSRPMLMSRIQRDLNSPSASVRVRALKAIASPTKSPYTHYDIPEAEQSLNFSAVPEPPDIKEVMRNIIVYVEVRSGEDNRSEGVRKVIEALGARVNLKLFRDTTHVVFKDGRMSTFKKAQQWGIPVVSILWIEECKTKNRICDPKDFPISNLDRYENPELYTKLKRFKCMQPDSEKFINRKVTGGSAQKDLTPTQKTGANKNSTLIGSTPTSSSNTNNKKTDISQYFKKLDNSNKVLTTPVAAANSPATLLLNRITNNCYTPLLQSKKTTTIENNENDTQEIKNVECYEEEIRESKISDTTKSHIVKKALNFLQTNASTHKDDNQISSPLVQNTVIDAPSSRTRRRSSIAATGTAIPAIIDDTLQNGIIQATPTPVKPPRRRSVLSANEKDSTPNDISMTPSKPPRRSVLPSDEKLKPMAISMTPSKNPYRRSSVHTPKNMSIDTPRKDNNFQPIIEEFSNPEETKNESVAILTKSVNGRRTLNYTKPMEITDHSASSNAIKENQPSVTKSTSRRTLYSCTSMSNSSISEPVDTSKVTTRRPTCYSVKSTDTTRDASGTTKDKSSNMFAQKSADLTNKLLNLVTKKAKPDQEERSKFSAAAAAPKTYSNNRRRTLYTPKTTNTSMAEAAIAPQTSDGICLTPTTSNMHGKVACSTLLESAVKNKPVQTPPATATTGKLLEETSECVTPFVFSSTRQPGNKRRTLFDVSMDIITQRLQCINQSARRSLAPTPADTSTTDLKSFHTPPDAGRTILPNSDTENLSTPRNSVPVHNVSNNAATPDYPSTSVAINTKKRKLFMPNDVLTTPPVQSTIPGSNTPMVKSTVDTSSEQKSVTKRRRSLLPLSQPLVYPTLNSTDRNIERSTPVLKRRSTLDFEQIKKIKNKAAPNDKVSEAADDGVENGREMVKPKKTPVLVHTNMHKEQIDVIREVCTQR